MPQIWLDSGPAQGLAAGYIAYSNDGTTWYGISNTNLNITSSFVMGAGSKLAVNYPYPNSCIITLQQVEREPLVFDIQDVVNQPTWQNANPQLTGNLELSLAINAIGSW